MNEAVRSLQDKVVVVTGGFGAAGRAIAEAAKSKGARVAVLGHGMPPTGLDFDHVQAGLDLADSAQAERAMAAVADHLGPFDSLLNIAGGFAFQRLEDGGAEVWERMFRINVLTTLAATRAALARLRSPGGSIVNVAAAAAGSAGPGMAPYAAAKSAVLRMTEALAEEVKGRGLRVNAVSPTIIDTPQNRADMPKADPSTWVSLGELSEAVLFLASDAASGVTGADLRVAGRT